MSDINSDLIKYSTRGELDEVKTLIKNGADVNAKNEGGWTALMMASENGHNEVVKILIENKADVNIQDSDGWTALMMASEYINNDVVKTLLIDYQAKVSDEDIKKLKDLDATFTLDLIAKRDFEKHLQQELRQIPETPSKKKSVSFKI